MKDSENSTAMKHLFAGIISLMAVIMPFTASAQRNYTPDPLVGEWLDKSSNALAQTYVDKSSGLYCLNLSHHPYANEAPEVTLQGKISGGVLEFSNAEGWTAKIDKKDRLIAKGPDWSFKGNRVTRVSPTLGAKAPEGAEVLFDGSNLDCWGAVEEKEWLKGTRPASEAASIVDGYLEVIPGQGSLVSKEYYKDYHMHLEFRLLGEKTNGGVYLQSRYELNIGDSWGGSGNPPGTFGNIKTPEYPAPAFNYALPPLVWQTLDVDFTAPRLNADGKKVSNAKVTMYLNGKLIYDDVEVEKVKGAAGKLGDAETGPVYLQEHGTAYQFNNIWLIRK